MDILHIRKILETKENELKKRIYSLSLAQASDINTPSDKFLELKQVKKVREAIERIDAGDYGTCASCDAEIPVEKLLKEPETDFCAHCEADEYHETSKAKKAPTK